MRRESKAPVRIVLSENAADARIKVVYKNRKIDEVEHQTVRSLTLGEQKPAIIDYNSIARNSGQLVLLVAKVSSAVRAVLTGGIGLSMILLCVLGAEQGYLLAKMGLEKAIEAVQRNSTSEILGNTLLFLIGVGYVSLSLCAGVIGAALLASFRIASAVLAIGTATAVLTVAGIGMYSGAALYGIGYLAMNLHFRLQLKSILKSEGETAALNFLLSHENLPARTNPFVADLIQNNEQSKLSTRQLLDLALEANAREIAGNVLLTLVGITGTLSFFFAPIISHILFIGSSVLWLGAMDHPEHVHSSRTLLLTGALKK